VFVRIRLVAFVRHVFIFFRINQSTMRCDSYVVEKKQIVQYVNITKLNSKTFPLCELERKACTCYRFCLNLICVID